MRVATFNLHAGVDGWGRPTKVLDHVVSLNADVLILPELWRAESGNDFVADLKQRLGMEGLFVPLASGQRVTSGTGGERILLRAREVLAAEFPAVASRTRVRMPDEKDKRHGQAIAAASLPSIGETVGSRPARTNSR